MNAHLSQQSADDEWEAALRLKLLQQSMILPRY